MVIPAFDASTLNVTELHELCKTLESVKDIVVNNKAYYFDPHAKQTLFFHPDRDHFPRFRAFQGGNRTGKTESGCLEACAFALGERPWDGTKVPIKPPNRGRIVGTSYLDGIKKVIQPKIKNLWPADAIESTKMGQQGSWVEIKMKNGSVIDLLSMEQEHMKHEGADLDWVWFDEPPPREHWIANIRGLVDRGGYAWLTMTPLSEPWILDEIILKATQDKDYFFVQASMYDNVGYGLTLPEVKAYENALTEDEIQVRVHGEWLVLQGLIYKEYRDHYFPEGHLVKPFPIKSHWPRWFGIDPHDRTPTFGLWMAADEKSDVYVFDEIEMGNMTIPEMADAIKKREENHTKRANALPMRLIDPASNHKSNTAKVGDSIWKMFKRNGIYCRHANNDIAAGHKRVRDFLRFNKSITEQDRPRIFFFDTLRMLRHSFTRYVWDEWKGSDKDNKYPKNKPRDRDKHPMDALRYALMANPHYVDVGRSKSKGYKPVNERTGY